jgi:hypothetical protein
VQSNYENAGTALALQTAFLRGGFKTAVEIAGNFTPGEIVICLGADGLIAAEKGDG